MKATVNDLVEIRLNEPDDFLVIKETLTRIGIASRKDKILYQSCHILHKQKRYFIVHFKEMFSLDGKPTDFSEADVARRNTIVNLLSEWGLLEIIDPDRTREPTVHLNQIKILPFSEKRDWNCVAKYSIGTKR